MEKTKARFTATLVGDKVVLSMNASDGTDVEILFSGKNAMVFGETLCQMAKEIQCAKC